MNRDEAAKQCSEPVGAGQPNQAGLNRPALANDRQVGGQHYLKYGNLQPWDMYVPWNLNGFQSEVLKLVVRYRDKGGIQDLEKAKHYLEKLIEVTRAEPAVRVNLPHQRRLDEKASGPAPGQPARPVVDEDLSFHEQAEKLVQATYVPARDNYSYDQLVLLVGELLSDKSYWRSWFENFRQQLG